LPPLVRALAAVSAKARQLLRFPQGRSSSRKIHANQRVCAGLPQNDDQCTVDLVLSLRYT
jgi:hypothetical protein